MSSSTLIEFNPRMFRKYRKNLQEYFSSYYNNNFLRDFRYIYDKPKPLPNGFIKKGEYINSKKYGEIDTSKKKSLSFLLAHNHIGNDGMLASELTYFKSFDDFKNKRQDMRYSDRLFFDLDIEDSRVDILKSARKDAYDTLNGKARRLKLREITKDFQDLIFNEDLLLPTFNEAKSLCNYLEGFGFKPYLIASASKGFHVNLFFEEIQLTNISQISNLLAKSYANELNLKYLDFAVNKDAKKRLQRVQYSINSKSGLFTTPLTEDVSYDDVLSILKKNKRKPIEFNFDDYVLPSEFNAELRKLDDNISYKLDKEKKKRKMIREAKRKKFNRNLKNKNACFSDIDMRDLVKIVGEDIAYDRGDKLVIRCFSHDDKNPSAVVYPTRIYCSTCNKSWNYYDYISEKFCLSDKKEIMSKLRELLGQGDDAK